MPIPGDGLWHRLVLLHFTGKQNKAQKMGEVKEQWREVV